MIPKKSVPDLIRDGIRFSEKIMLQQKVRAGLRFNQRTISVQRSSRHHASGIALFPSGASLHARGVCRRFVAGGFGGPRKLKTSVLLMACEA
jgi:hypothetical protein